jgi:PAS domain S-box-containing protein
LIFEIEGLKGTRRWLETHAVPMKNEQGKIISLLGITRDVTERRKTDEKLKVVKKQTD